MKDNGSKTYRIRRRIMNGPDGVVCEQAQKNIYFPKLMAEAVLAKCRRSKYRDEKNMYHCEACGGWHLTSKDLE